MTKYGDQGHIYIYGPLLSDVPGFQLPPDSIFPPQLRSSSTALPLHLHVDNCSDFFSCISSFDVPEPFQPSPGCRRCRIIYIYIIIGGFHDSDNIVLMEVTDPKAHY